MNAYVSANERAAYTADTIRKMLKPMRRGPGRLGTVAWRLSRPRTTAVRYCPKS